MTKKDIFTALVLTIVIAWSGIAQADSVTVKNRAGMEVSVQTFNGNDAVCMVHYNNYALKSGEDKVVSCDFGGTGHCKLLVEKFGDSNQKLCGSGVTTHSCGSSTVVYVAAGQSLTIYGNSCAFVVANGEVQINKTLLKVPGGGWSACLTTAQATTLAANSRSNLNWQSDGNLVVYSGGRSIWSSGTNGNADQLCFQGDGNLVIYKNGSPTWATGTNPSGQILILKTDCTLAIVDSNGNYLWRSQGTTCN